MSAKRVNSFELDQLEPVRERCLPIFVPALPDEALISWLARLTQRLEKSIGVYEPAAIGLDSGDLVADAWRRPGQSVIARMASRVGLPVARLRAMTFEDWVPIIADDEVNERFGSRWYQTTKIGPWRARRVAVCPDCLAGDREPYLRLPWTLGWVSVCSRHGTVLRTRCPSCHAKLRAPTSQILRSYSPAMCVACGAATTGGRVERAAPRVVDLHTALMQGKRSGFTTLPTIGRVRWAEAVEWIDRMQREFWRGGGDPVGRTLFGIRVREEFGLSSIDDGTQTEDRYLSLVYLTWLVENWPANGQVAADQIGADRELPSEDPR